MPRAPHPRRRKPVHAFAWLLPAALVLALLAVGPGVRQGPHLRAVSNNTRSGVSQNKAELIRLKEVADQTSASLQTATKRYAASKSRYELAQARLERTRRAADRADAVYERYRKRVASFAAAAYGAPLPDSTSVLLTTSEPAEAVQRATSLDVVTQSEARSVARASAQKRRADALAAGAAELATSLRGERHRLADEIDRLRRTSERSTGKLTRLLLQMSGLRASRGGPRVVLGGDCAGTQGSADIRVGTFANGLIPDWALCPLPGNPGKRLRPAAADAFTEMNIAYAAHFGKPICVTDAYRSLGAQQSVFARKPGLAAVPGTSNHGWGYAVDLGCGVQDYGSRQFDWLKRHGARFGWVHPAWAEHSPFEPWHWEYEPGTHTDVAQGTPDVN